MKPLLLYLLLLGAASAQAQQHPNIILIVADDLGYGDPSFQGNTKIHTPHLDSMARRGTRFTQFYAGTAVCAPSRASLLTGLHTGHTAVRGNRGYKPEGQFPLPDSSLTIATVLKQHGYTTGVFGKWGLGYPGSPGTPLKKGFTHFFGYNCQTLAHDYYPDHLWKDDEKIDLSKNKTYSADLIHQQALQFLQQEHTHPFFLFLAYTIPHAQLQVPHDSTYEYYQNQFHDSLHASFAAMVTRLDRYVGDIITQVQNLGIANNTLILFTSDNGPHREGGGDPDFFNSNGGLRGIKRDLYEGGIRVPFLAKWPGHIQPNTTNNNPATFWDLFPTFETLAGIPITKGIDGIPITWTGKPLQQHEYLYWEFHENGGSQAVRWGKWKGVKLNINILDNPPLQLFNLEEDPKEQTDIAAQHPDIVKQINVYLKEAHQSNKDWPLLKSEKP
ncbi:MAG: arylsulfatase [Bacteroidetes bacterium]|nr:arylsulfatase [Bacteroidota bacterium]